MGSLILQTATRLIFTLLLLFSIFILLRGHNEPGGGFIAGLVTSGAFVLYSIAYDVASARRALRLDPRAWIAIGLLLSTACGLYSVLMNEPFLTGKWASVDWIGSVPLAIGTPMFFDIGVYFVVIGITLTIIFSLAEES
jgi:multicomponent Na+:H+ antiporter subunit B